MGAEAPADDGGRMRFAFECALARPPDADELLKFLAFFNVQRTAFVDTPHFAVELVQGKRPGSAAPNGDGKTVSKNAELAAWIMVASTLLNLDETMNKP